MQQSNDLTGWRKVYVYIWGCIITLTVALYYATLFGLAVYVLFFVEAEHPMEKVGAIVCIVGLLSPHVSLVIAGLIYFGMGIWGFIGIVSSGDFNLGLMVFSAPIILVSFSAMIGIDVSKELSKLGCANILEKAERWGL